MANKKISQNGLNLIMKFEGCRLQAYKCAAGVWTIGYGHTAGVSSGMKITQAQAEEYLKQDCQKFENYVNDKTYVPVAEQLNQNQFDALVSFAFNCGQGNLKKLCAGRNLIQIGEALLKYNKAAGKVLTGLVRRRAAEQALFNTEAVGAAVDKTTVASNVSTYCLLLQKAINADKVASLTEDGIYGPKTQAAMNKICLKAKKVNGAWKVGSTGACVKFIQARLGISEDGKFGSGTRAALISWQGTHGLTKDGMAGPATLKKMI